MAIFYGFDPYGGACIIQWHGIIYPPNPLTTIIAAIPFAPFGWVIGGMLLWSSINALLVFALLKNGKPWQFLIFTSAAYWQAFRTLQWSPLMAAILLLPGLIPLTLVKPQIGLPVFLTKFNRRRILICLVFGLSTFIIDPTWIFRWLPQIKSYDGYIPLLILPFGPLIALSLLRWRQADNRFLFLMSAVPQRGLYDLTALWLIPKSAAQMLMLSGFSWIAWIGGWFLNQSQNKLASIAFVYLPALVLVLWPLTRSFSIQKYLPGSSHQNST